ncbi:MAG: hypothetical protein WAV40_02850 [Microgenomates group bacterium]
MTKIDGNVNKENSRFPELPRVFQYLIVAAMLLGITTACGKKIEAGGVKLETTTTDLILNIEPGADAIKFDVNTSPFLSSLGVTIPDDLYVQTMNPDDVEAVCDRKDDLPGIVHGCLLFNGIDQYLAVAERGDPINTDLVISHETKHAILLNQIMHDESLRNMTGPDIELFVRYMVLNEALYNAVTEHGWDLSDQQMILDQVKQNYLVGDSGGELSPTDQYLYKAMRIAGGVTMSSESRVLSEAMFEYALSQMALTKDDLAAPDYGGRFLVDYKYQELMEYLMSKSASMSQESLIANYAPVENLP